MPNGISIDPAVLHVYLAVASQTDTQTHRPYHTSVAIGRIYMLRIYDAALKVIVDRPPNIGRETAASLTATACGGASEDGAL